MWSQWYGCDHQQQKGTNNKGGKSIMLQLKPFFTRDATNVAQI
jgi:hypothetical protein